MIVGFSSNRDLCTITKTLVYAKMTQTLAVWKLSRSTEQRIVQAAHPPPVIQMKLAESMCELSRYGHPQPGEVHAWLDGWEEKKLIFMKAFSRDHTAEALSKWRQRLCKRCEPNAGYGLLYWRRYESGWLYCLPVMSNQLLVRLSANRWTLQVRHKRSVKMT